MPNSIGSEVVPSAWDTEYEWKVILLLALGLGLVGLDRWIIAPLFPFMMSELQLSYQDLGNTVGALAIVWGVSSICTGHLADQIGRRKVAIPALVIFSLMSALTGMVTGAVSLLLVRGIMGASEGAYLPACTAAASEASAPSRRGRGLGFVLCTLPLMGLGIGPIVATQLLRLLPSWRWVFGLVAVPGLILAVFLYRVLRESGHYRASSKAVPWSQVIRSKNIMVAVALMICAMSCIFVLGAMVPSYLVDYLKLSPERMGIIISALGAGGCAGNFLLPMVSDYIGRKMTVFCASIISSVSVLVLIHIGAAFWPLYVTLFMVSMFSFGILATSAGPIAAEALTPELVSTAVGIIAGAGEIFGGGVAPIIAGFVADHYGIQRVLYIGLVGCGSAIFISLLLTETAPRVGRR
jgi:MFS family permease